MAVGIGALLLALLAALGSPDPVRAVEWGRSIAIRCEPPATYYGSGHAPGGVPCCATQPGVCPGGLACPSSGQCPGTSESCVPTAPKPRPNVILLVSDDQGYCHFGSAGECRSVQSGTAIPAPVTPNLDVLAGYGTVFPITHNTSPWCFPSLSSILTGRYQRNMEGRRSLSDDFATIPGVLRGLPGEAGTTPDPFDPALSVGGYCTFLGGKFTPASNKRDFDAQASASQRRVGRLACDEGADEEPDCGTGDDPALDPSRLREMGDLFEFMDAMFYPVPDRPGTFATQPFMMWFAPRNPHAPLRAPASVRRYLFGDTNGGLGGLFQLGTLCDGKGGCAASVKAFKESNIGNQREFYASVWWMDDTIRELRKYLARKSAPHCIQRNGETRFSAMSPEQCGLGTWTSEFLQPVEGNTILIYLSDNGWFLPDSKHTFSENGYRTSLFVFDPRTSTPVPPWNPAEAAPRPPNESPELAHSTDVLTTILGFALDTPGTQACPIGPDGTACDGRDLRPYLHGAPGGPPSEPLRRALCGHHTETTSSASRNRYLLTRPGSVGRCVDARLPACTSAAQCAPGELCLGGRCTAVPGGGSCGSTAQCPAGSACLGRRCQVGPPCLDDVSCVNVLGHPAGRCVAQETRWCRNAPNQPCTTAADCPACPLGAGNACGRLCETQQLKLYVPISVGRSTMVDLFADPDERVPRQQADLARDMSSATGPYGADVRRLSCCLDDWWPDINLAATQCGPGDSCPANFDCNE